MPERRCAAVCAIGLVLVVAPATVLGQDAPRDDPVPPPPVPDELETVPAGTPITLDDAMGLAAANNTSIRRADVALRRTQVTLDGEGALLSPILTLEGNYSHRDEPTVGLFEDGLRVSDSWIARGSLSKRFRWGTDLVLSYDATRFKSRQPFEIPGVGAQINETGPLWTEGATFSLRQPLLKGFGEEVNLATEIAAAGQLDVAKLARRQTASNVALEVALAYLELWYADQDVVIRQRQIEIALKQRRATAALVRAGRIADVEIDVVDQRLIVLHEALLVSLNQRLDRLTELQRLIGDPRCERPLTPSAAPELSMPATAGLAERALENNPDVAVLREQIEEQRKTLPPRANAVLPSLDLTASIGQTGLEKRYLDALGQIGTLAAGNVFIGLMFSMPLDNGRAEAQLESERLAIAELTVQMEEAKARVLGELRKARSLVELNDRRVEMAARGVELANRNLEAEQARFFAGRSTNQTVLQFQEQLEQAEVRLSRSRIDLALSIVTIQHLTGELLDELGLEAVKTP